MNSLAIKTESTFHTPITDFARAGFTIAPMAAIAGGYLLELSGFLAPGWSGRLATGLADHRVSIVSGSAEKINASHWRSRFELKSAPFAQSPESIDFLALAATEPHHKSARIELLEVRTEPASRHGGSLFVEIRGKDRLGFLGDLLDHFSMRCLFPVKMTIDTHGDTAVDRFLLRGVGGSLPSEAIAESVRQSLQQLLIEKR